MIDDLGRSLRQLLINEIGTLENDEARVRFEAPSDAFTPPRPAINLFLYDVRENRDLRSNEWIIDHTEDGNVTRQRSPVRVDCSYLITAWGQISDAPNAALDEQMLLSEVMRVLLRYPTLPAAVLQGKLSNQELPLPTAVLLPGHLQSLGEFWQALGGEPRAALNYTVTISVQPEAPIELGAPVSEKRIPG